MTTRKVRKKRGEELENCSFKSPEPKKRKCNKKEHAAKPLNLSSSFVISSVVASDVKESSVSDDVYFLPASTTPASAGADDISVPYSYATTHKGSTEKGLAKKSMNGVPILMYTSDEASLLMETKKTSNAKVTINIDGIVDAYKITANKTSLKLMDVLGRRTINVQNKFVTVHISGKVYNCDEDCFLIKKEKQTMAINTQLSLQNEPPIFTTLSFVDDTVPGSLKRKALVLDLAYLHSKKKMTTWSLLDNALNSISFFEDWGKKPE